jgi:hypothetical protein
MTGVVFTGFLCLQASLEEKKDEISGQLKMQRRVDTHVATYTSKDVESQFTTDATIIKVPRSQHCYLSRRVCF